MLSRTLGARAILLVGVLASLYASFLFVSSQIAPGEPTATHDLILKSRLSSPEPSSKIVIIDIDERSLASFAPLHGRWPWPRSVLADGLDRMRDLGARAILFNVLLTDPDRSNPDSDSTMEVVAAITPNAAFPVVRLNPENDPLSKLRVGDLLQWTGDSRVENKATVAVLLPVFEPMLSRVGIANQYPDSDGIVRRYPIEWVDQTLTMPSIVARTLQLGGRSLDQLPTTINLNWRNKTGKYTRISFSDLLNSPIDDPRLQILRDSFVVVGVSAPGLGMTKATSVRAIEDDNEILATAIDDILNDTHLRLMPDWLTYIIQILTIWTLVWMGVKQVIGPSFDKFFYILQLLAGSVTILSVSYTPFLIDLSTCMGFGAGLFGVIKLIESLDAGWSRARPGMRVLTADRGAGRILLIGYRDSEMTPALARRLQNGLEKRVGLTRVIRVDDLFGGESFVKPLCEDYSCQLCLILPEEMESINSLLNEFECFHMLNIREVSLDCEWNAEDEKFRAFLSPHLLRQCADLIDVRNLAHGSAGS